MFEHKRTGNHGLPTFTTGLPKPPENNGQRSYVNGETHRPSGENFLNGDTAREPLRVLVIAAGEAVRDEVEAALHAWPGPTQLYWVTEPGQAPARLNDLLPQVALVDVASTGDPTRTIRQLAGQAPQTAFLALVDERDVADARQAVLAGARGFLIRPLVADELAASVRQVLSSGRAAPAPDASPALGHVITFIGPKGGTGRTTTLINSAVSLHQLTDEPVAVMDADWAAPAVDVALNLRDERDVGDLLPRLARLDDDLLDRVLADHASGLRVLLAPPPTDHQQGVSPTQMVQILAGLRRRFAWVLVDLGLPLDEGAMAAVDMASQVVITVLPEMVGLRNARLLLSQLRSRGVPPEKTWLVLNRATIRGGVARRDIEERLRIAVRHEIPDDQPLASLSVNRGVPLVLSHPRSAVARSIRELAKLLAAELNPAHATTKPNAHPDARQLPVGRGLLQRLLSSLGSKRKQAS